MLVLSFFFSFFLSLDQFKLRIFQYVCIINYFRSGDSTTRFWKIADGACDSSVQNEPVNVVVLQHFKESTNEKSKDVTTLDWNVNLCSIIVVAYLP